MIQKQFYSFLMAIEIEAEGKYNKCAVTPIQFIHSFIQLINQSIIHSIMDFHTRTSHLHSRRSDVESMSLCSDGKIPLHPL